MDDPSYLQLGLRTPAWAAAIPGSTQNVCDLIDWQPQRPNAAALAGAHSRFSYAELDAAVNVAAAVMAERGVGRGSRVAMSIANQPEVVIAFLAVERLAAISIGINLALAPVEKAKLILNAGAVLLIAEATTNCCRAADPQPGDRCDRRRSGPLIGMG